MISTHRIIIFVLLLASFGGIAYGYILLHPELYKTCPAGTYSNCSTDFWIDGIGSPLYWSTRWLPVFFFFLLFVRREVFNLWWKVALPLAIFLLYGIITSPLFPNYYQPDRTRMTEFSVWVFIVVSGLVICWKYWRLWVKERATVR